MLFKITFFTGGHKIRKNFLVEYYIRKGGGSCKGHQKKIIKGKEGIFLKKGKINMEQNRDNEMVYCEYEKGFVRKQLSCLLGKDKNGIENGCWERPVKCGECIYGKK